MCAVGKKKINSEIMAISNRYKNNLDDFINRSDPEFLPKPINKGSYNASRSRGGLTNFLDENCLNQNISVLDKLSWLAL